MSISSMLGSDNDKPTREPAQPYPQNPVPPFSHSNPPASVMGAMSPPQHTSRPSVGEYPYKPRSQTPEQFGVPNLFQSRPHRSSSSSMVQRPGPFGEPQRPINNTPFSRFGESSYTPTSSGSMNRTEEVSDPARRTSISDLMQRPNSQPQPNNNFGASRPSPFTTPSTRPAWLEHSGSNSTGNTGLANPTEMGRRQSLGGESRQDVGFPSRQTEQINSYDTRPPGFNTRPQQSPFGTQDRERTSQPRTESTPSHQTSPDTHRQADPSPSRTPGTVSNDRLSMQNPLRAPDSQLTSQPMMKQDSAQSQGERSIFGDRLDRSRPRLFSPFGSSVTSQPFSGTSAPPEDQSRKGSDELSQHRLLLGVAADAKRGRFSPLPQAVQGAQAQSLGPDKIVKTESGSGRVFSGIGGGVPTPSVAPASGRPGLSASPFRRDEGTSRLSEENLMKVSRDTPGIGKRARRLKDEEGRASSEMGMATVNGRGKRARHHQYAWSCECAPRNFAKHFCSHHHYKVDNDEFAALQRRSTPLSGLTSIRQTSTPTNGVSSSSHHHHHHRHTHHNHTPQTPSFKSNTMIKISPVLDAASKTPRRHLGSFLYNPKISTIDNHTPLRTKLNVSIQPNLLPSWRDPDQVNCTYTVRVSKTWLRRDEREAICAERYLWGSGIFTDDSDPVAAAIHSGYLKGAWGEWVDTALLEQIIQEQNPKIDAGQEHVPTELVEPRPGMDLHITLLVLPQLERYEETVRYGVKSRSWPEEPNSAPHDGVSFMVLNCEWVNERTGRGKGRTGEERRQRLRTDFANGLSKASAAKTKILLEMSSRNMLVKASVA
jgi:hypothetical protein